MAVIQVPRGFAAAAPSSQQLRRTAGGIRVQPTPLLDVAQGLGQLGATARSITAAEAQRQKAEAAKEKREAEKEEREQEKAALVKMEEAHLLAEERLKAESEGRLRTADDIAEYNKSMSDTIDELTVTDEVRARLRESLGEVGARIAGQSGTYNRAFNRVERRTQTVRTLGMMNERGYYQQARDLLAASKDNLTTAEVATWNKKLTVNEEAERFRTIMANEGLEAAEKEAANIFDRVNVAEDVKRGIFAQRQTDITRERAAQNREDKAEAAELAAAQETRFTDRQLLVDAGLFSRDDIIAMRTEDEVLGTESLTEAQYRSLLSRENAGRTTRQKAEAELDAYNAAMDANVPVDPTDTAMKKAATVMFDQSFPPAQTYSNWSASDKGKLMYRMMNNSRPAQVEGVLSAGVSNTNPGTTESAAKLAADIQAASPAMWGRLGSESERAFYNTINAKMNYGATMEEAVGEYYANSEKEKAYAVAKYADEGTDRGDNVEDFHDRVLADPQLDRDWFDPEVLGILGFQYDGFVRDAYSMTLDLDSARATAWERMRSVTGHSSMTGTDQIMFFPPELYGGRSEETAIPSEWLAKDFTHDIRAVFGGDEDASKYSVVTDRLTPTTQTYGVIDDRGLPVYGKDNQALRWRPDMERYNKEEAATVESRKSDKQRIYDKQRKLREEMDDKLSEIIGPNISPMREQRWQIRNEFEAKALEAEEFIRRRRENINKPSNARRGGTNVRFTF